MSDPVSAQWAHSATSMSLGVSFENPSLNERPEAPKGMSERRSLPPPEPSTGPRALRDPTCCDLGAPVLHAALVFLLPWLSIVVSLSRGRSVARADSDVMVDSHACLLGSRGVGAVRWHLGGEDTPRHVHLRRSEHRCVPRDILRRAH